MSSGKFSPLSDTLMASNNSDDSDSTNLEHSNTLSRNRQPRHGASFAAVGRRGDSSNSSSDSDDDDTADEDWVAVDADKKRIDRRTSSLRSSSSQKRVRPKCHPPGHRRPGSQSTRSSHRNAHMKNQPQTNIPNTKQHPARAGEQGSTHKGSLPPELTEPRQCFGPGCTRAAARPDTKYCSKECGIKLAIRRLEVLLPERLRNDCQLDGLNRTDQSIAEQLDKKQLEKIQTEKCAIRDRMLQLEVEHQKLTSLIAHVREIKFNRMAATPMDKAAREAERVEQMEPVICVTCSSEVSMRHALRHMEKCFQKMEGSTVFCASQKEQIVGTPLFCDTYDNQAKAFCKRLRVVCEHFKEPKLPPDTICGYPLVRQVFTETGQYCTAPRNKCSRHLNWERLRRAHIDIERYRCLIRMDELLQEEQRLHQSMSQRGGLLGLLLHQTIDHNPSVPVPGPPELRNTTESANGMDISPS